MDIEMGYVLKWELPTHARHQNLKIVTSALHAFNEGLFYRGYHLSYICGKSISMALINRYILSHGDAVKDDLISDHVFM